MTALAARVMPGQEVLAARIVDRGDLFWFASLDGELWIEVTDDPRLVGANRIDLLMNPEGGRTLPMRITRRFLSSRGAVFLTGECHA